MTLHPLYLLTNALGINAIGGGWMTFEDDPPLQFLRFFLLEKVQKTTTSSMLICLCAFLFEWLTYQWHGCSDKQAREKCDGMSVDGVGGASPPTIVSAQHARGFVTVFLSIP